MKFGLVSVLSSVDPITRNMLWPVWSQPTRANTCFLLCCAERTNRGWVTPGETLGGVFIGEKSFGGKWDQKLKAEVEMLCISRGAESRKCRLDFHSNVVNQHQGCAWKTLSHQHQWELRDALGYPMGKRMKEEIGMEEDRIQKKMELGSKMDGKQVTVFRVSIHSTLSLQGWDWKISSSSAESSLVPYPCLFTLIFIQFYCDDILKSDLVPGRRETHSAGGQDKCQEQGLVQAS